MKKIIAFVLITVLVLCSACGKDIPQAQTEENVPTEDNVPIEEENMIKMLNTGDIMATATPAPDEMKPVINEEKNAPETQTLVSEAETWLKNEITLVSDKEYGKPLDEATLDLEITDGTTSLTVPGFWDGGNIWRIRFALPNAGTWTYKTVCSDQSNKGLDGITGSVECKEYSGELDIYKHGFVKTEPDKRYFVYNDGTPFLYIGDTHWNFLSEEYDFAGNRAGELDTPSHFKYIVNKRVSQGYTVYQTEPIGAKFDICNGITKGDISGFRQADKYFEYIAEQGMVHANAQFFFPSGMVSLVKKKNYRDILEKACRYWIARYSAYPVLWTLGQEVDNEAYFLKTQNGGSSLDKYYSVYPYKEVCTWLYKYDPYKHPISAHQEGSYDLSKPTSAYNSDFLDVEGHTWWATQWKPVLNQKLNMSSAMDYWNNGQGKPAIMYEGRYDHLWTNEYGARVQGWIAFLNGMYGYGYGCADIWLYKGNYDMDKDTVRDGIRTTVEEKNIPWSEAIELPAGYQVQYMKEFFETLEWWKMIPRFNDENYFTPYDNNVYYSVSTIDENKIYIAYFYGESTLTGAFGKLDASKEYVYQWYNPRTNIASEPENVPMGEKFSLGARPTAEDWVLLIKQK